VNEILSGLERMAMEMPLADLHALRGLLASIASMAMARLLPR